MSLTLPLQLKLKGGRPSHQKQNIHYPGGEGTPYNDLYGEAPPERGIFFRLQVYKRVGTLLVEVYERAGKSVMRVCERAQRVNR